MGGLSKENMPRVGDIICDEKDSLTETAEFTMQVAVQDHPGQLKAATYDEKSKEYPWLLPHCVRPYCPCPGAAQADRLEDGQEVHRGCRVHREERHGPGRVRPEGPDRRDLLQGVRRSRPCRYHGLQRACHARQGRQVLLQVMMGQSCELQ